MLDFGEAVRRFYGNYANPNGRSQRSAYWWVLLYQTIIVLVLMIVILMADGGTELFEAILGANAGEDVTRLDLSDAVLNLGVSGKVSIFLFFLFTMINILPDIMLEIRRFHDLGQTGWLVLVFRLAGALPVIGFFAAIGKLIWFTLPGTVGANKYGPDPLQNNADVF